MNRSAVAFGLACVACSVALLEAARAQAPGDGPRYANGTNLVRPPDYREWTFLGSGLGLTYQAETAPPTPNFTNVFVNPSSYRAFMQTGAWPNGTVFVLEGRGSQTDPAFITQGGRFQTDLLFLEAEVKDSRFADGWAFFAFGRGTALIEAAAPLSGEAAASCVDCHTKKTAVERTFVQFYPTLLEVARRHGTAKPGF